jgi:hypothetical protein
MLKMNSTWIGWIVVFSCVVLWSGTSLYGHYTGMKARIAEAEAKAEETQAMFFALRDAALAAAKTNNEALTRAIERLAEREGRRDDPLR